MTNTQVLGCIKKKKIKNIYVYSEIVTFWFDCVEFNDLSFRFIPRQTTKINCQTNRYLCLGKNKNYNNNI